MDKSKMRNFKGITLIALVITIIVLLILAGIAISMIAGNNGILTKAVDAKKANEKGIENDKMSLAKQEALIESYRTSTGMSAGDVSAALGLSGDAAKDFAENYQNNVSKFVEGVPIPTGFVYVEGTKKDDGLIVVDKYGNEFVWVPIVSGAETTVTSVWSAPGVKPNSKNITDNINTEYNSMKTSVATYGGFYVGRYETSWTGSQVASVGNVDPMNGQTKIDGTNKSTWYTFYTESKKLHNDSVVSSMIYNSQWNAIMKWMDDVINTNVSSTTKYINNSTGMGHYNYDSSHNQISSGSIKTGSNENYKVKNIYDLAGNMYEWTQKSNGRNRVHRGGRYNGDGTLDPVSFSAYNLPTRTYDDFGSRLTLYIK